MPYGVLAGNHDVWSNTTRPIDYTYYSQWFGRDRFADQPYYGGDRENNHDDYDLISYGGHDFIMVYLGWQPTQESFDWANEVLQRFSNPNAILAAHQYIAASGKYEGPGQEIFEKVVVPNENILLVLNGHALGNPIVVQRMLKAERSMKCSQTTRTSLKPAWAILECLTLIPKIKKCM